MTKDSSGIKNVGDMCTVQNSKLDKIHASSQTYISLQTTSITFKAYGHHISSFDIGPVPPAASSSKNIFSLPLVYLFHSVLAGSETAHQPTTSSFIDHLGSSQSSSVSASPVMASSLVPAASSSASSLKTLPNIGNKNPSCLGTEADSDFHQISTSEQSQVTLHFRQHIHREGEFVCGWGAAFINICITFPMNKTMFRQQLHGISGLSAINQLRKDGPRFLYRGLLPPLLQKSSSLSVMFGMYYKCQDILNQRMPRMSTYVNHTVAAVMAGTMEAIFTPFERIQALMQTREYHNKFANTLDAFYGLRSYGLSEYYRGLSAIILRNGPSNVAFFLGREYLQQYGPQSQTPGEKMTQDFFSGACLGAVISTCFFPLNVLKIHMQCVLGGPFTGMWTTLKTVVAERNGFLGLYRGVHLNFMRSFISWGVINASYEFLMKTFFYS